MKKLIAFIGILALLTPLTFASEATGTINTGIDTGVNGTVIAAPSVSPAAGTYSSTQSVSLTASGSTAICYRTDSTAPTCATSTTCSDGSTKYASALSISTTTTVKALSCYPGNSGVTASSAVTSATYTISSGGGGGGSGGGSSGGGSSVDTSTYTLPTTTSETELTISRPVDLSAVAGILTRPVEIFNPTNSSVKVEIPKDTAITTADGAVYTGQIAIPQFIAAVDAPTPVTGTPVLGAISVGSDSVSLVFSKPVTVTVPVTIPAGVDPATLKVFYFDTATSTYKLAGNGGTLSANGKTMSVDVLHFTKFAVLASTATEIAAKDQSALTDLDSAQWYYPFVAKLISWNVIAGYADKTFRPGNTVNRAEFTKMVALAFGLTTPTVTSSPFGDVPKDAWYTRFVIACKDAGAVSGYADGTFRPDQAVNRAEALKIILTAAKYTTSTETATGFSDVSPQSWYATFVKTAVDAGILAGYADKTFKPGNNLTRAEAAKLLVNTKEKK